MVYDSNSYLDTSQMTVNAQDLLNFFLGQGWTKNAICGMLGNMQTESTINYGIWESLDSTNTAGGFGLVQWTPSTVYTDWASANGYGSDHVNGEKQRILYELANNVQWISTSSYPMTFQQFTQSTDTPENLAYAWLYDYERPASLDQPSRQTQARYWYDNLTGGGTSGGSGGGTSNTPQNQQVITMLLTDTLNGWKW